MLLTTKRLTETPAPPLHYHPNWWLNVCVASFFVCNTNTYTPVRGVFLCGLSLFTHFFQIFLPSALCLFRPCIVWKPNDMLLVQRLANTLFKWRILRYPSHHLPCLWRLNVGIQFLWCFLGSYTKYALWSFKSRMCWINEEKWCHFKIFWMIGALNSNQGLCTKEQVCWEKNDLGSNMFRIHMDTFRNYILWGYKSPYWKSGIEIFRVISVLRLSEISVICFVLFTQYLC